MMIHRVMIIFYFVSLNICSQLSAMNHDLDYVIYTQLNGISCPVALRRKNNVGTQEGENLTQSRSDHLMFD